MTNVNYRPEIDGLRALAVISVIFAHADIPFFRGGFIGVDIFFVISGYLITNLLMNRISNGTFSYTTFFVQRMRRLLPALIFMVAITAPLFYSIMMPEQFKTYVGSIFSTTIMLANFYFLSQLEYWQSDTDLQPLVHMWSLSIEEQYYLLYPFFLLLIFKLRQTWILSILITLTLFLFLWSSLGITNDPGKNYFHSFSRFWQLGFGCTLSLLMVRYQPKQNALLATLGLMIITGSIIVLDEGIRWPSIFSFVPVLGAMLFIGFANNGIGIGKALSFRPIRYFGLISYSLYLWHQPVFATARTVSLDGLELANLVLSFLVLFFIASFSYYFIEKPIRYVKNGKSETWFHKNFISICTSCFVIVGSASLWTYINISEVNNFRSGPDVELQQRLSINFGLSENCYSIESACRTNDAPTMLIWGDSYAMHLVPALMTPTVLTEFEQRTMSGCPPYIDYAFVSPTISTQSAITLSQKCIEFNRNTLQRLTNSTTFRHVVISSPFLYSGDMYAHTGRKIELKKHKIIMQLALSTLIENLNSMGLSVTIVSPPPRNGKNIGLCISKLIRYGYQNDECDFSLEDTNYKSVNDFFSGVTGDFDYIDLSKHICPNGICQVYQNDTLIYRDSGHLSIEGSPLAVQELRKKIYDFQ